MLILTIAIYMAGDALCVSIFVALTPTTLVRTPALLADRPKFRSAQKLTGVTRQICSQLVNPTPFGGDPLFCDSALCSLCYMYAHRDRLPNSPLGDGCDLTYMYMQLHVAIDYVVQYTFIRNQLVTADVRDVCVCYHCVTYTCNDVYRCMYIHVEAEHTCSLTFVFQALGVLCVQPTLLETFCLLPHAVKMKMNSSSTKWC